MPGPNTTLLDAWWGGGWPDASALASISLASNLVFGGNPLYQISDFLAFYPKFGTGVQGVLTATLGAAGTGYAVNNQLVLVQPDAAGCVITVNTVSGPGAILTFTLAQPGTGYSGANALPVTGGSGTGATFSITAISPFNAVVPVPVIQAYINLAAASLSQLRWGALWPIAMAWFVAHFLTLYLRSEGNAGSTPGAIARSGLAGGIIVSQSAGDVSRTVQPLQALEEYAAWQLTWYGVQLATAAKTIGMGMIYAHG